MHASAFETGANDALASGLDHAGRDAEAPGPEGEVVHALLVGFQIADAFLGFRKARLVDGEGGDQGGGLPRLQLVVAGLDPAGVLGGFGIEDRLGHRGKMFLGVEEIDDLDGVGKMLGGDIPDPGGTVSQDDLGSGGVEAGPAAFPEDQLGKVGGSGIGIPGGRAEDPAGIADRAFVPNRDAPVVGLGGGPGETELGLPGFGGAVFLLSGTSGHFVRPHGNAGAVPARIDNLRTGSGLGIRDGLFVRDHLGSQGLGCPLHLLGGNPEASQGAEQLFGFLEADEGGHDPDLAKGGRRIGGVLHPDLPVPGKEPGLAGGAVVIGPGEAERAQDRLDGLLDPSPEAGDSTAGAGTLPRLPVREIPVQGPFQKAGRDREGRLAEGRLQGFEVEGPRGLGSEKRDQFLLKAWGEKIFEFFFPPPAGSPWTNSPGPASA